MLSNEALAVGVDPATLYTVVVFGVATTLLVRAVAAALEKSHISYLLEPFVSDSLF